MPSNNSPPRLRWHTVAIAALTIGVVWWFLRSLDFHNVWTAITHARLGLILLAVLATFQTYVIRAWRWQALLRPIGRARFGPAFRTTVIGFTANFLLPGRIGEVLRPYMLARQSNFSAAAAFATVIIERVLDLASVLVLFAFFLMTTTIQVPSQLKLAGVLGAAVAVSGLVLMAISAGHPERLARWAGRLTRVLPGRAAEIASGFVHTFVEGLAVMRRPGPLVVSFALSILLWLSISLGAWLTSAAFDLTFPFTGSFLVLTFLVVGVSVPTPAGIGTFQAAYQYAVTTFFGAAPDPAGAAAIILHAVSFIPISILGLALMGREGLTLGGLKAMKSTAEEAERS